MRPSHLHARFPGRPGAARQRGIAMVFALIALMLLLVGAAALLRTVDSSAVVVGNLAFRRDLTNRAEAAIASARAALASGAVSTDAARAANEPGSHYFASRLPNGANGLPDLLLSNSTYEKAYGVPAPTDGVTLRWVIDRQCVSDGAFDTATCELVSDAGDPGGTGWLHKPGGATRAVYRVSVRVTGPRGTESYFQTTYAN